MAKAEDNKLEPQSYRGEDIDEEAEVRSLEANEADLITSLFRYSFTFV